MRYASLRWTAGLMLLCAAVALSACNDIVYRDAKAYEDPPAGAGDFLGYSSIEAKRTVCGNCHVGKQAQWQKTAHADAFATLEGSGSMQGFCQACHAVSSLGNDVTEASVGWVATENERYHDVQCESCHGPGLTHVLNPDAPDTKPLATIAVGTDMTRGCGECHSGAHRPFVEEWAASRHSRVVESRATNVNCVGCHEAKGILEAWGVNSTFMVETGVNEHPAVTCAVCHNPHDARNPGQLRFSIDVPAVESNLCMKCHHKRAQPELASSRGPHSPEGPLLLGEAGWFPPNFAFPSGALVGSHGSDRNPRLCATCHVRDYQVNDPLTGSFTFRSTGHSFQAIPCVDAAGQPSGAPDCDLAQRSFANCTSCHLSETGARSAYAVADLRISRLIEEVQSLIARIPSSEFSTTDNRYTTAEGTRFNMQLAQKKGSIVHNPFLVEALLIGSISQVEIDYGITPSLLLSLQPELTPPQ